MFNASRLIVARQRASLTKRELAEKIDVDPRAVSGFEAGEYEPAEETLTKICRVLKFSREFFCGDDIDIPSADGVSFRSMTKMSSRQRDAALAAGAIAYLLIDWVERKFDLPDVDLPDFRDDVPDIAARSLRHHWGLGERPIKNMIHLLEAKGVRVFSLAEDCLEIDAYSVWRGRRPCVFLNTKKSTERSRFDAAHELGHLVLHKHASPNGIEAEKEAHAFAAAFLMPEASLKATGRITNLEQILSLKAKWLVSVAAMTRRAYEVGLMSKWHYQALFTEVSTRGWRTSEPMGIKPETSQIWQKVFAELRRDGVGIEVLSAQLNVPVHELVKLVFGLVTVGLPSLISGGGNQPSSRRARLRVVE